MILETEVDLKLDRLTDVIDQFFNASDEWLKFRWGNESDFYLNMTFKTNIFNSDLRGNERLDMVIQRTKGQFYSEMEELKKAAKDRDWHVIKYYMRELGGRYLDIAMTHSNQQKLIEIDKLIMEIADRLFSLRTSIDPWR